MLPLVRCVTHEGGADEIAIAFNDQGRAGKPAIITVSERKDNRFRPICFSVGRCLQHEDRAEAVRSAELRRAEQVAGRIRLNTRHRSLTVALLATDMQNLESRLGCRLRCRDVCRGYGKRCRAK